MDESELKYSKKKEKKKKQLVLSRNEHKTKLYPFKSKDFC